LKTSAYQKAAEVAKKRLDTVSPTFCLAKWNQVSLHLTNGMTNSCYHPPLHKIDATQLDKNPAALHNTAQKIEERQKMLAGDRPKGCSYCWNIEDTGGTSDRIYRSGEPWAIQDFESIVGKPMDSEWTPRYVEVNFNNACNFKCSYCSPQFSTTWAQEIDRYGQYPTSPAHNAPEHFDGDRKPIPNREHNPYREAFWRWWPTLYKNLKHFRMTGGEPLMDTNTYKVLQWVIDNPKKDLHLNVTSNMCPPDYKLKNKYFDMVKRICLDEHVEHFMQFVSVDAFGEKAEYIRHGLNWAYFQDTVEEFLERIPARNSVTFIITYNNLSVTSLDKLLEYIRQLRQRFSTTYQRIWFDIPLLRQPAWQQITMLPESYQQVHQDNISMMQKFLEGEFKDPEWSQYAVYKDFEIQKMLRNLAYWRKNFDANAQQKRNFYAFFNEHDRRRGTSFERTFPEMIDFWQECKNA
jgi:organic radical activating enzyme